MSRAFYNADSDTQKLNKYFHNVHEQPAMQKNVISDSE